MNEDVDLAKKYANDSRWAGGDVEVLARTVISQHREINRLRRGAASQGNEIGRLSNAYNEAMAEVAALRAAGRRLDDATQRLLVEAGEDVDALGEALTRVLQSASPNAKEHPTMYAAWGHAIGVVERIQAKRKQLEGEP
jgi:hypothetical protein